MAREQTEQVAADVRGLVIHYGHNNALEQAEELANAYLSFLMN